MTIFIRDDTMRTEVWINPAHIVSIEIQRTVTHNKKGEIVPADLFAVRIVDIHGREYIERGVSKGSVGTMVEKMTTALYNPSKKETAS